MPQKSSGTSTTKPPIGPPIAMSNSARREGNADLDHRPQRPRQRRKRDEEGKRGVDVVTAAHEVVPHLVRAENPQYRGAVSKGHPHAQRVDPRSPRAEVGRERDIMTDAQRGRRPDGQHEQQDV
jgi:hypothetical protein